MASLIKREREGNDFISSLIFLSMFDDVNTLMHILNVGKQGVLYTCYSVLCRRLYTLQLHNSIIHIQLNLNINVAENVSSGAIYKYHKEVFMKLLIPCP